MLETLITLITAILARLEHNVLQSGEKFMSVITYVILVALCLVLIILGSIGEEEKMVRTRWIVLGSMLLAIITGVGASSWTEGIPGRPKNLDRGMYYRLVGVGTSYYAGTPVFLQRPNGSIRAIALDGHINSALTTGTLCKVVQGEANKYDLEPLR